MQLDTTWTNLSIPPFSKSLIVLLGNRSELIVLLSATNSNANEDAEPQQVSQLHNPANLDLTESQKASKSRNGEESARESNANSAEQPASDHMFQVTIGTKSLLKFLSTNVSNSGTIACMFWSLASTSTANSEVDVL